MGLFLEPLIRAATAQRESSLGRVIPFLRGVRNKEITEERIMTNDLDVKPAEKPKWLMLALFLLPLVIMAGKLPIFPASTTFTILFSVPDLPDRLHRHVEYIIFVPLSALVVAFFRLTLGIQVLGFFRPILLAIAFRIMGLPLGVAFLVVVLAGIALLRPLLRNAPYYARVPMILSLVAAFVLIPVIAGRWWQADWLNHLAYFPVIALGLACEGFVKILDAEGMREAAWRVVTTILVGVVIAAVVKIPGMIAIFFRFPELLIVQAGLILVISEYLDFQCFEGKNPFAARPPAAEANAPSVASTEAVPAPAKNHPSFENSNSAGLAQGENIV
jgi:hypothetical protein